MLASSYSPTTAKPGWGVSQSVVFIHRVEELTVWHTRVYLHLVLDIVLAHVILQPHPHLVRTHGVILHRHHRHRRLEPDKVLGRHHRRVRQRAGLDKRPNRLRLAGFHVLGGAGRRRPREALPRRHLFPLAPQQENVPRSKAVPNRIDPAARRDGIGKLVLARVKDLVQNRQHLFLRVPRQPHVDQKSLGRLGRLDLEGVEERPGRGGLVGHHVARVGRRVAAKEVGHDDDIALGGEAVGLDLVVDAADAGAAGEEEEELGGGVGVVGGLGYVDLRGSVTGWGLAGVRGGAQTSTSARVVISPVPDWPAGVGLLDVQCSLRRGAEADAVGAWVGISCASLSGALVVSSVSVMLSGMSRRRWGVLIQDRWFDRGYLVRLGQGNGTRRHDQRMLPLGDVPHQHPACDHGMCDQG